MPDLSSLIAANVARVRARIAAAADAAGRCATDITLVAVTKYVQLPEIRAVRAAGCLDLGENRPQTLWEKAAAKGLEDVRWHLVGHLQRNKVARTLPCVTLVHSVDSRRLVEAIERVAAQQQRCVPILLEVNVSGDTAKHGLTADQLRALLATPWPYRHVALRGLMTMAAREGDLRVARENFARLRELHTQLRRASPAGNALTELSMGMSRDLEVAIEQGATIVRVGSALFAGLPK